jgi:hypothetical protein
VERLPSSRLPAKSALPAAKPGEGRLEASARGHKVYTRLLRGNQSRDDVCLIALENPAGPTIVKRQASVRGRAADRAGFTAGSRVPAIEVMSIGTS